MDFHSLALAWRDVRAEADRRYTKGSPEHRAFLEREARLLVDGEGEADPHEAECERGNRAAIGNAVAATTAKVAYAFRS